MPETCLETPISEEDLKWIADNGGRRGDYEVTLEYQHYSAHTVLSALLPPETKEIPAGFEMVGHIAHLNLRKEVLPYKAVIGMCKFLWGLTVKMGHSILIASYGNLLHVLSFRTSLHANAYINVHFDHVLLYIAIQ